MINAEQLNLPEYRVRHRVVEAIQIDSKRFGLKMMTIVYYYRGFEFITEEEVRDGDWVVIDGDNVYHCKEDEFERVFEPNTKDNWNEFGVKSTPDFAWAFKHLKSRIPVKRSDSDTVIYPTVSEHGLTLNTINTEGDLIEWLPTIDDLRHAEWDVVLT